jgi:hypothetical protein
VYQPRETLNIELKDWFDPDTPEGKAKIVRACIAMRNRGTGGFLVVGFDNSTMAPNLAGAPPDVRGAFHADKVNGLVNRHASEAFEILVHFPERDGQEFPVLEVEAGAETLVAARRPLAGTDGKDLVEKDAIYVRSLSQNNTPSTGKPRAADWRTILDPIFERQSRLPQCRGGERTRPAPLHVRWGLGGPRLPQAGVRARVSLGLLAGGDRGKVLPLPRPAGRLGKRPRGSRADDRSGLRPDRHAHLRILKGRAFPHGAKGLHGRNLIRQ